MILAVTAPTIPAAAGGGIPQDLIDRWSETSLTGPEKAVADIVANQNITDVALNRERYIAHDSYVNYKIKTGDITNQKSSGRCWMFSGLNVLRPQVIKKYKLKNFEFSQNYLLFWDKMEKINQFLQYMIDFADRPLDDRELEIVIDDPMGDGGWWTYLTDLIRKYGLVPKGVMPESQNSSSTGTMNSLIGLKIKEMGVQLREMARSGSSATTVEKQKEEMLTEAYRMRGFHDPRVLAVHRIDRFTSGLVVVSRAGPAFAPLRAQFAAGTPERVYLAVAEGRVEPDRGRLVQYLAEHPESLKVHAVGEARKGRRAACSYRVIERFPRASLLEVRLETGRRNQIRVQLAAEGHALVGDASYGRRSPLIGRTALHASRLAFDHPRHGQRLTFEAPPPADFNRLLAALRRGADPAGEGRSATASGRTERGRSARDRISHPRERARRCR